MHHSMTRKLTVFLLSFVVLTATSWILPEDSEARKVRNSTRHSVHKGGHRNVGAHRNKNVRRDTNVRRDANVRRDTNVRRDRDVNVRRDTDIDISRDVNIDVDHDYRYRHPVGTAVGVAAAATITAAAIGSIVYSLPPSCQQVVANGIVYQQCGNDWYQPQYSGSQVNYIVVNPPY